MSRKRATSRSATRNASHHRSNHRIVTHGRRPFFIPTNRPGHRRRDKRVSMFFFRTRARRGHARRILKLDPENRVRSMSNTFPDELLESPELKPSSAPWWPRCGHQLSRRAHEYAHHILERTREIGILKRWASPASTSSRCSSRNRFPHHRRESRRHRHHLSRPGYPQAD